MNVNSAKERGVSKITDDNLVFINIEVLRCRSSLKTCRSTIDAIKIDSSSFLAESKKKQKMEIGDVYLLKQNYKALQRQEAVDFPRI